jgi:hypothetical protein
MSEQALSRIPFLRRDELMILSMSRWMRFIAAVKIIGGFLTVFVLLVALIFVGIGASTGRPELGKLEQFVAENRLLLGGLWIFAMILAVAGTVLGYVLYHAADDFDRVARSDEADQDYVANGLLRLKIYIQVSILLALAGAFVGIAAGAVLFLKIAPSAS